MSVGIYEAFGLWPEGDQSPADKPHLRHSSIAEWFKAEGLTGPLSTIAGEAARIAKFLRFVFLILFVAARIRGRKRPSSGP